MPVVIGSNIASLRAQRSLHQADGTIGRVFERLSTGQRINRASDDAAGLSIVSGLNAKSRVLNRAGQNLSDAQSLLTIADGTYDQASSMLVRMAELAEQAANGTLSSKQRKSLDLEYQAMSKEIIRISASTSFNGLNLTQGVARTRLLRSDNAMGTSDILLAASRDSRFQLGTDYFLASGENIDIRDSLTNEVRSIYLGTGSSANFTGALLANGDAVYAWIDGNTGQEVLSVYSWETRSITELARGGTYLSVVASDDGSTIAYTDVLSRVTVMNLATKVARTHSVAGIASNDLKISADGRYVAGASASGMTILDFGGANGSIVSQSVSGTGLTFFGITNEGTVLATTTANLGGTNGGGVRQIFSVSSSGQVRNLTSLTVANQILIPTMNADGSALYFISSNNSYTSDMTTGGNRQLFKFDLQNSSFTQLTAFTSGALPNSSAFIAADGSKIATISAPGIMYEYNTTADDTSFDFEAGFGARGNIATSLQSLVGAIKGLGSFALGSSMQARAALDQMQRNLAALSQSRGMLGAAQSRLQIAERLSLTQRDEAISAAGRISNADVAAESAELVRASILKQSGAAILAQANQQTSLALTLLRS